MAKKSGTKAERTKRPPSPTRARDEAFEKAHAFLNKELFGGKLPNDFSFNFINRANSKGHFSADAWGSRTDDSTAHEINLNPASFHGRTDEQILSTLAHEMCHQLVLGKDGLPKVAEIAFGALKDQQRGNRRLVTGVNWSPGINDPFRSLGKAGESAKAHLAGLWASNDEPIIVFMHLACPRMRYTDRGKSAVVIS